ncbi:Bifunctional inhibitor/plant lipid transfer protein/seed storage helical domain [Dillenia turbinata]|uniref:Bifunctional inhibitor/plant lipid transfer protein/seed storage helical domain n=1 Tax=Dillenia turbinata TaxID=194707 RepID=A0AAN8Z999_9MAGN
MAKLLSLAALALLLVLADAKIYRKTVTVTEISDDMRVSEECQGQVSMQKMSHCEMYLKMQMQSPYGGGRMVLLPSEQEHMQECCRQMSQMDEKCRCDGVNMVVDQMMRGRMMTEEVQKMMEMARRLPGMCMLKPETCQVGRLWF